MSMHVALTHITEYRYDRPVRLGPQIIRLRPAPHSRTRILSYSLQIAPDQHFINWQQDPQANYLARVMFPKAARGIKLTVDIVAEMAVLNPFDFFLEPSAESVPFSYPEDRRRELLPYLEPIPAGGPLQRYISDFKVGLAAGAQNTTEFIVAVNRRVHQDIGYVIRLEPGVQTPEQTLERKSGSCRDSAWLLVHLFRHLGLAARFVSGYLIQLSPDIRPLEGPAGTGSDFTDLHAWCEVYLPGAGWIGLDPTSGLLAGEGHIPLACAADPSGASPVSGATDPCEVEFAHHMQVRRVLETPRTTKPYSDSQWQEILSLGDRIDQDLQARDVRLTMGGEPTFVSIEAPDQAEWNTEALGPRKRLLAENLVRLLKDRYAPHGVLHYGQGKRYPGEPLPRWSLNALWRTDGMPIWADPSLLAREETPGGATEETARRLLCAVAEQLGLGAEDIFPAYEDIYYYLWRERRLPSNVDPFEAKLEDSLERARLRRIFTQGLHRIVGHVLPLARTPDTQRWHSGRWFLRDERCYLIPGDSPLGYRLPLDSLPWVPETEFPWIHAPDLNQALAPLPTYARASARLQANEARPGPSGPPAPVRHGKAKEGAAPPTVGKAPQARTALCAEPRDGHLYIFLPPVSALEDWLELVAAVESAAARLRQPVILEGYEPPRDPRVQTVRVTPDPGVIEVNVQPAGSWRDLVDHTTFLYEATRDCRLAAEKFMIDGRHTGTGGGNHIVLGAAQPADSPFLRRPELLASMLAYWHQHPSLSYLFSGLFIGPTSQAPRLDEARHESVYELEIALRELRRLSAAGTGDPPPWQVDRLLRHLLTDVTGNTHRAEFCIDKLYAPEGAAGRLGLLEMRGFEMPPHAQMSLTQQLLLRALVSRFWHTPFQPQSLQRWGTELHDRFMLPHFVWHDFCDVLEGLQAEGYDFAPEWFGPHFEFRFPRLGEFEASNITVALRMALEPWHVLGEETGAGGAVRYVDSSVERIQLKVLGMIGDRHRLSCNGRPVPLQATGCVGEYVGAVRYKAWSPASTLHPTIRGHAPLTFDLVDTWTGRSLGGCQYLVAHPGGRNYASVPLTAYEAEARRRTRFLRMNHSAGPLILPAEPRNPNYPFTLDLRRG